MNIDAYLALKAEQRTPPPPVTIAAVDLHPEINRTLMFGFDCDRDTWHLYLERGRLNLVIYNSQHEVQEFYQDTVLECDGLVPNKRCYPESCDYEFSLRMTQLGFPLPFTTFSEGDDGRRIARTPGPFAGLTLEELS